ncbi:MAG TPA: PfkB family carbohydrate kinase [Thermoanaerobaculia bacterium]|nr:PfkB family carbohydrate kinase [Thermoanaerobaculia bacterium]
MPDPKRLSEIIDAMQGRRIVVWGDLVADRFIYGTPKRISREAPVLILKQYREDVLPGGGGNAIRNIIALGGIAEPLAVVGRDSVGDALLRTMEESGVDCDGFLRLERYRTPTKTRVLGGMPHAARQQIVRFDLEDTLELTDDETSQFESRLQKAIGKADAALISDYGYGTVEPSLARQLITAAGGRPVTLDSRYAMLDFPGVTAATPNEDEAAAASGIELFGGQDEESRLEKAGHSLIRSLEAQALLITRGSRGMALFEKEKTKALMMPVRGSDQVADVTGAGDTVIATFTLALAAGASFEDAAHLANYAGGIVVMKMGTATASAEELRGAIRER